MANTIWKYPISFCTTLDLPADARVLSVQIQGDSGLCLWALVDSDAPKRARRFQVFPTGGQAPPHDWPYIGTVQDGALVWHVFEQL